MNKHLSIGIIGTGKIARIHANGLKNISLDASLEFVASHDVNRAKQFAEDFGINTFGSINDIFESRVECVLICTTAQHHPELIIRTAESGKHIFCEKPIGYDLSEIDAAISAVKKAGVVLFIGFNRRFDPHFRGAYESIRKGEIGKPEIVRITSRDPRAPSVKNMSSKGALFLETMIHDLDMARFLAGDEIESITVLGDALVNPDFKKTDNVDTAIAVFKFNNGALGTIDNSWRAVYGYDQRAEILGSQGMYSVENIVTSGEEGKEGIHGPLPLLFFPERYADSYLIELNEFIRCVMHGEQSQVTGEDGRTATILALAARKSCEIGCSVNLKEFEAAIKHG